MPRSYADAAGSSLTLRWRKTDSNSRSLREGTGAELVARGEAELGVAQASEIVPVAGAQLIGPLPGELA